VSKNFGQIYSTRELRIFTKNLCQQTRYVEQEKRAFPVSEWVEVQTVREYFSRLASQQKGLLVSEEEGEDEKLEKDDYMEQLVGVAEQEIGLRHPLVYDDFNFCDLFSQGS